MPGVDVYEVDPKLFKHCKPIQTLLQARFSSGPLARCLRVPARSLEPGARRSREGAVKFLGSALREDFINPPPARASKGSGNSWAGRAAPGRQPEVGRLALSRWNSGRAVSEEPTRAWPRAWEASLAGAEAGRTLRPLRGAGRRGPLGRGEARTSKAGAATPAGRSFGRLPTPLQLSNTTATVPEKGRHASGQPTPQSSHPATDGRRTYTPEMT